VQVVGDEKVGQLPFQTGAFEREGLVHLVQYPFPLQPQDEPRLVVLLGQAGGFEDDAEQGEADIVPRRGTELAGCRVQPTVAFGLVVELQEVISDLCGQLGEAARCRPVIEVHVHPQCPEHLGQVRLAAPIKAADPHARLLRCVAEIAEVGFEDAAQPLCILPIADEGLQLVAQGFQSRLGAILRYLRHTVVEKPVG
jgi:hypothetical protein